MRVERCRLQEAIQMKINSRALRVEKGHSMHDQLNMRVLSASLVNDEDCNSLSVCQKDDQDR